MPFSNVLDTGGLNYKASEMAMVINDDSLNILKKIKSNSIDLIFADPPYNLGKDFGNDSDKWDDKDIYLTWCKTWLDECFRILKDSGTFYFMNATQNMPALDVYVDQKYHILSRIIWSYDSSGVQPKRIFGSLYEPILMCTKTKHAPYTFNREAIMVETITGAKRKIIDYRKTPPQPYNTMKVPGNVWEFPRVRYKMFEYENHPSQKPESLLERIILASSNEGDVVLDPFSGSFTTCAVAQRLHRKSIGIDLTEDYFKIGLRRLGLASSYQGEPLERDLGRKTNHKSKKTHQKESGDD